MEIYFYYYENIFVLMEIYFYLMEIYLYRRKYIFTWWKYICTDECILTWWKYIVADWEIQLSFWANIDWKYILILWKYSMEYSMKYILTKWNIVLPDENMKYILTYWTAQSWEWESQGPMGVVGWKIIFMIFSELIPIQKIGFKSMAENTKIRSWPWTRWSKLPSRPKLQVDGAGLGRPNVGKL